MSRVNIRDYQQHCTDEGGWTKAFKQAVVDLGAAGGIIYVPAGEYLTSSIQLESHIELYLESGAILRFIQDKEHYELVETEFEGIMGMMYKPCIYAREAEQVTVSGRPIHPIQTVLTRIVPGMSGFPIVILMLEMIVLRLKPEPKIPIGGCLVRTLPLQTAI